MSAPGGFFIWERIKQFSVLSSSLLAFWGGPAPRPIFAHGPVVFLRTVLWHGGSHGRVAIGIEPATTHDRRLDDRLHRPLCHPAPYSLRSLSVANMVVDKWSGRNDKVYTDLITMQYDYRTKGHERRRKVDMNYSVMIVLPLTLL